MSYLAIGILFVLIVGGFITFLVMNATRRSSPAGTESAAAPGMAPDETPLGDTSQHAGEQDESGHTVSDNDAGSGPGVAEPEGRYKRDPIGGEAEAAPFAESDQPRR